MYGFVAQLVDLDLEHTLDVDENACDAVMTTYSTIWTCVCIHCGAVVRTSPGVPGSISGRNFSLLFLVRSIYYHYIILVGGAEVISRQFFLLCVSTSLKKGNVSIL